MAFLLKQVCSKTTFVYHKKSEWERYKTYAVEEKKMPSDFEGFAFVQNCAYRMLPNIYSVVKVMMYWGGGTYHRNPFSNR